MVCCIRVLACMAPGHTAGVGSAAGGVLCHGGHQPAPCSAAAAAAAAAAARLQAPGAPSAAQVWATMRRCCSPTRCSSTWTSRTTRWVPLQRLQLPLCGVPASDAASSFQLGRRAPLCPAMYCSCPWPPSRPKAESTHQHAHAPGTCTAYRYLAAWLRTFAPLHLTVRCLTPAPAISRPACLQLGGDGVIVFTQALPGNRTLQVGWAGQGPVGT